MLLWVGAVGRLVGILGSFKVWTPPVGYNLEGERRVTSQYGYNNIMQPALSVFSGSRWKK